MYWNYSADAGAGRSAPAPTAEIDFAGELTKVTRPAGRRGEGPWGRPRARAAQTPH